MTSSMLLDRSQPPVIVVLAGNNTLGARAVAAARHLVARHCKIVVAEPSLDPSEVTYHPHITLNSQSLAFREHTR